MVSRAKLRKARKSQRTAEKPKPPDSPDASRQTDSSPSTSASFKFDSPPRSSSTAGSATWSPPPPQPDAKLHEPEREATPASNPASATAPPARSEATSPLVRAVSRVTRMKSFASPPSDSFPEEREIEWIEWAGLRDFFLAPSTDGSNIDTTMVPKIVWKGGKPIVRSKGRFVSFQEENEGELDDPEAMPDLVLLTREAYEANPDLPSTWRNSGDTDSKMTADDVKIGSPSWTQVASVVEFNERPTDETKARYVYANVRARRSLEVLAAVSIRSHAFGVFVHDKEIVICLHTPSGLFYSPTIDCTKKNGYLSTILARLHSLSDRELGIIASLCDDAFPTSYTFPCSELPPRPIQFQDRLSQTPTCGNVQILDTLSWPNSMFGRRTSAYRVSANGEGQVAHTEWAMTISFVEEARCDDHDRIRLAIASASPIDREGLTKIVDVYRENDFVVVPRFLPEGLDAEALGLKPRAMEVTFQEQCYAPISIADSTKALTKAILGASQGLRSLYRLGILHRDVSAANIMIASSGLGVLIDYDAATFMEGPEAETERRKHVGSFPFRARDLIQGTLERTAYLHQPWHDVESLVYSIVFILFINPTGPEEPIGMSKEAERIWHQWQSTLFAVQSKELLLLKSSGLVQTLAPFAGSFKKAPELVGTVAKYCGLGLEHSWIHRVDEGAILGPKWNTGELSHDGLISDLRALLADIGMNEERVPGEVLLRHEGGVST